MKFRSNPSILLFILFLSAAARFTLAGPAPRLHYVVRVTDMEKGSIHVTLDVDAPTAATRLRLVPTYMDNPVAKASEPTITNLTVRDADSRPLRTVLRKESGGERLFIVSPERSVIRVEYDLHLRFEESAQTRRYPIRIPYMNSDRAWLYGNYVFCYPEWTDPKQKAVSQKMSIGVDFQLPQGLALVGAPSSFAVTTIYQLMSLQFAFGQIETVRFQVENLQLELAFEVPEDFTEREKDSLEALVSQCFLEVIDVFGSSPVGAFTMFVFRDEGIGGMEGSFSCQVYAPKDLNLANGDEARVRLFRAVVMHEIFHTWVPIFMFPTEDPWIKEGVTGYYGEILSARAGILQPGDLEGAYSYYLVQLEENPLFRTVSLLDKRLWANEYQNEQWRTLTYDKGKVVAAMLDVAIRENTSNQKSLDDLMRALYTEYAGGSYTHEQLTAAAKRVAGADLDQLFRKYVRGTALPSRTQVREIRQKGETLGIWRVETLEPAAVGAN